MTEDKLTLIFFDLETTGLNAEADEVIEIGAIKVQSNEIVDHFNSFVRPVRNIPQFVTNLTGITLEDMKKIPDREVVKKQVKAFIGNDPLIAHNVSFDKIFLEKFLGERLKNEFFDTLELARLFFPSFASHSLQNLVESLSIQKQKAHRALSDTMMLYGLFQQIVNEREKTDPYLLHKLKEILQGIRNYDLIFGDNWERANGKETPLVWEKKKEVVVEPKLPFNYIEKGIDQYLSDVTFIASANDGVKLLQGIAHTSFKKRLMISVYSDFESKKVADVFKKEGSEVNKLDNLNLFICPDKIDYLLNNVHLIPPYFRMHFAMLISYLYKTRNFSLGNAPTYIRKNPLLKLLSFCDKDWKSCKYKDVCPLQIAVNSGDTSQVLMVNHSFFFNKQNYNYPFMKRSIIFLNAFRMPKVFSLSKIGFSLNDLKFFAFYYKFPQWKIEEIERAFTLIDEMAIKERIPDNIIKSIKGLFLNTNNTVLKNFFGADCFWVEKRKDKPFIFSGYSNAHGFFRKIREEADSITFVSPTFSINNCDNVIADFSGIDGKEFDFSEPQTKNKVFSAVPLFLSSPNRDSFVSEFTHFFERVHKKDEKTLILFSSLDILRKVYFAFKSKGYNVKAKGTDQRMEAAEIQIMMYDVMPVNKKWSEIYFVKMPTFFSAEPLDKEKYYNISFFMLKNISLELLQDNQYCALFYIDGRFKDVRFRELANDMFISFPLFLEKPNSLYMMLSKWREKNKRKSF